MGEQRGLIVTLAWVIHTAFTATAGSQAPAGQSPTAQDSLKRFLQDYLRRASLPDDKTTRYIAAFVDLDGDGKNEAIVYLIGRWWCGSGGCPTFVLASEGSSYRVVTKITITQLPVRVLTTTSYGWRNITVWVSGGGIEGYEAELPFNGKKHPSNPSVPPARRLTARAAGKIVITESQNGMPLYP